MKMSRANCLHSKFKSIRENIKISNTIQQKDKKLAF